MKTIYAMLLGMCLTGCLGLEDEAMYEDEAWEQVEDELMTPATRPPLSSICGYRCNNSHGVRQCSDHRNSGQVNVSVFPLIENTTKVPSTILGTTTGWANTSCPNCQWALERVTTTSLQGGTGPAVNQAVNDVNVSKTVNVSPEYDWQGDIVLRIWDPTDSSVGSCTLSVTANLSGGFPF